jgi:beta-glucosidase
VDRSFPEGFLWGAATSAYQVEGAVGEGGRGPSIWDTFSRIPGKTRNGDSGEHACDQYHRYEQDADLMVQLGIGAYRFSVAWPRIQPNGSGRANQRGLDYYRRLVDALNRRGIVPVLTLFHWDLPQALQDLGGWPNRDTAERFADYADIVHGAFSGEVPYWITVNEPWCAAWLGYGSGVHAPGLRDDALALAASHHLLLAHGLAAQALSTGEVGIALNVQPTAPASEDADDVEVARLADLHMNAQYLDPVFGQGYPDELLDRYRDVSDLAFVREGDLETIARPLDFLGVNYYRRHTVTASRPAGVEAEQLPGSLGAWSIVPPGVGVTAMRWPIEPDALTEVLLALQRDYAPRRIVITENGAAFDDVVGPAGVEDPARVSYLVDHVEAALEAICAGVELGGFFVWSLLDNFEWSQGYAQRFGLVYVDFPTQERVPKRSARWYSERIGEDTAGNRRAASRPGDPS